MQKKIIRKLFVGVVAILVIISILYFSGIIQVYKVPTSSNEPGLKFGSTIYASNLISPDRYDFICFKAIHEEQAPIWVKRICGMPGETIEIIDGVFFADGKNIDANLDLKFKYYGIGDEAENYALQENLELNVDYFKDPYSDTLEFYLTTGQVKGKNFLKRRINYETDSRISAFWKEDWSTNQFGPVSIPENHYFVLGDNRDASFDSKYIGFIYLDNVVGVVW